VFRFDEMPKEEFATSMGLVGTPRIRFVQKRKIDKNIPFQIQEIVKEDYDPDREVLDDPEEQTPAAGAAATSAKKNTITKVDRLRKRVNHSVLSDRFDKLREHDEEEEAKGNDSGDESEDDLIIPKRLDHELSKELVCCFLFLILSPFLQCF